MKSTYNTIKSGNIVKSIQTVIRSTNFVGMSDNKVCHVRPHGRNAKDIYPLPVKEKITGATEYKSTVSGLTILILEKY